MNIKDIVYGDIKIPDNFKAVIDTPEFQRLRRIKQLATANLVFPSANHTRFEHCIGVFHVMRQIVDHFIDFFQKLDKNMAFARDDIDAVLMAALLHDLGHGPFSHAFEQALNGHFDHEAMTVKIIGNKETEINKQLVKQFGRDFPQKVISYLDIRNEYKGNVGTGEGNRAKQEQEEPGRDSIYQSFAWIFRYLVNSQLDADRMDYILRDSKVVGVSFGNFSISDVIAGMQITFYDNNYFVCIQEKYLAYIEGYLYARYQMYCNVYMDIHKIFTEELLSKIIKRGKELFDNGGISVQAAMECMFSNKSLPVNDFCKLDDHVLMGLIFDWSIGSDKILSMLCKAFLDRHGFKRLALLNNEKKDVDLFKEEFLDICSEHLKIKTGNIDIFNTWYFWVENVRYFSIYSKDSPKIYILFNDGLIKELADVSPFVSAEREYKCAYYIHFELLRFFYEENKKDGTGTSCDLFISRIEKLIDSFSPRKQLEIETKYIININDENIFSDFIEFIKANNAYKISNPDVFFQEDTYYDYKDHKLRKSGKSIRMRSKNAKYVVTYKEKIDSSGAGRSGNQTARKEREINTENSDIIVCWPIVKRSIPAIDSIDEKKLMSILAIKNNRTKYIVSKDNFEMELVLDDVIYCSPDNKEYREKQIEIELKSPYEYRINLKLFTELLEDHFGKRLEPNFKSKLERGLAAVLDIAT
jgi:HD superfamily phosphohydrolase/uncharacterized protein YjbK